MRLLSVARPGPHEILAAIGDEYRPSPSRHTVVADAYFDTAAFDFLRSGLAFRLRGTPVSVQVTLDSLDRSDDDLEIQRREVGGAVKDVSRALEPASWPENVRERVRASAGRAPRLVPLCVLHRRRESTELVAAGGGDRPVVAKVSLDLVDVFDPRDAPGDGSMGGVTRLLEDGVPVATFSAAEVEPGVGAAPGLLRDIAKRLRAVPGLALTAGDQLERALGVLADRSAGAVPGAFGITAGMPMPEAARLVWRRQLLAMLLNEASARRGKDSESIHDMRVATRRARAAARLFRPFFHRKPLRGYLRRLRRVARALGAVRDADVALQRLREYAKGRPATEQQGLAEIRAVWRAERRHALQALLERLDSPGYRSFVAGFAELCGTPGLGARLPDSAPAGGATPSRVGDVLPSAILNRFEQIRAYESFFASIEPVSTAVLHALRIDCKALRYSLEPVEHLLGPEGSELIRQLKRLQDLLGDLQDAVVADGRLAALADVVEPTPLASYRASQQSIVADLAEAGPAAWRAFVAPGNRRLLALALARL